MGHASLWSSNFVSGILMPLRRFRLLVLQSIHRSHAGLVIAVVLGLFDTGYPCAQASLAGPRLFPRGARAAGFQETVAGANDYRFRLKSHTGQTLVEYRLPLDHASMLQGVLVVEEMTTGVVPIAGGGLSYRTTLPPILPPPGDDEVGTLISAYDLATDPNHTGTLLSHSLDAVSKVVTLRFRDSYMVGGTPVVSEKTYALRLLGKSLEIRAKSDYSVRSAAQYNHAGFAFGNGSGLPQPNLAFHLPYMDQFPVFVGVDGAGGVFVSRIVDWYVSNSSQGHFLSPPFVSGAGFGGETTPSYYCNDANPPELNAPIDETVYVTVSRDVQDVMAVVDRAPSAYRRHLAHRAVSQSAPRVPYSANTLWVNRARGLEMDDMAHIKWDWSKWPWNLNDPDLMPAAPGVPCGTLWGSASEWLDYANAAAQANWIFAPYFFEFPNDPGYQGQILELVWPVTNALIGTVALAANPAFDANASVRNRFGQPKLGWNTELNLAATNLGGQGVGHPTQVIGPHLRAGNLTPVANAIHGLNGYTPFPVAGAHTDAACTLPHWTSIDQRENGGFPKTIAENLKWREVSFGALKDGMDGPLFGENSHFRYHQIESFDAGLLDGTSRKIPRHWSHQQGPSNGQAAESQDYLVVPDFELSEVVTKATGFYGMGYEQSFDAIPPWGQVDPFVDAWDTTLLSYGHAPYFGTNGEVPPGNTNTHWDWQRQIRSYYLCHGVSKAMRTSTIEQVRYVDANGSELTLSQALVQVALGTMDLTQPRLKLRFANGLEFKANHSPDPWMTTVLDPPTPTYTIPSNGFLAAGPDGLLAFSAINPVGGQRVDYAYEPGHSEMIDLRGHPGQSVGDFPGALWPGPAPLFSGLETVIVHDLRENNAIYGHYMHSVSVPLGSPPLAQTLKVKIDDTNTMSLGRQRLGVRAVLVDTADKERDVTGLCAWSSSDPSKIKVNRFGGLTMVTAGSATITATFAPGKVASRVIHATNDPVVTPVVEHALTSNKVLLSFTTDSACASQVDLRDMSTMGVITLVGRRDPAQKTHHFAIDSLVAGRSYEVTPRATNRLWLTTIGNVYAFTTPP